MTISAGGGMDGDEGDGKYGGALTLRGGFANGRARINKAAIPSFAWAGPRRGEWNMAADAICCRDF